MAVAGLVERLYCPNIDFTFFSETMISLMEAACVTELARDQAPYLLPGGQEESYLEGQRLPLPILMTIICLGL